MENRRRWILGVYDNGHKKNVFDKVNEIKQNIKEILPEIDTDNLLPIICRIRTYYCHKLKGVPLGRKGQKGYRPLTLNEKYIYDYILKKRWKPDTVYNWFLATRLPEDIREQLIKGKIGQKQALQIAANRRRVKFSATGLLLLEEIRNVIQKLDWGE